MHRIRWTQIFRDRAHLLLFLTVFIAFLDTATGQAYDRIGQLRSAVISGDAETKRTALYELRNIASPTASLAALPALKDSNEIVRATAASSVIFLENSEGVNALRPLLSDRAAFVRREAAYALGKIGNWSATEPLIRALNRERDAEVRLAIVIALGDIGDIESIPNLNSILRQRPRDEDEMIRRSAARSLGQIATLIRTGTSYTVSPESFLPERFKSVGDPTAILANRIDSDAEPTIRLLIKVLDDRNESNDTRREAAFALGAFGNVLALPALERYVSDPDPYFAEIAHDAIKKIRAVEDLRGNN